MKLKTLKDFNIDSVGEHTIEEVRQEAIKWIKSDLEKEYKQGAQSVRHWIIWFFDITEEELRK